MGEKLKRILTGVQSTGVPHLGNILGAIIPAIEFSKKENIKSYLFIADFHSLTQIKNSEELKKNTLYTAAAWLACGLNPDKTVFYKQSDIPQVSELAWYLSCFFPFKRLSLAHSFKDKQDRLDDVNAGLFNYPMLMAADILLYDASHVPVGNDQKQHLELTRDIAQKFNNDFSCEGFIKVPEPIIQKEFSRIMSLKDGQKKMSKSDLSEQSRINLNDDKDTIINKIKKAKTDSSAFPANKEDLDKRPEAKNLINIYCSISEKTIENAISEFQGKNFSFLKDRLSDLIVEKICPIGNEIKKLLKDKEYLLNVLKEGNQRANAIAQIKLRKIYDKIGFLNLI